MPPLDVSPPIGRKVPGATSFLHHLLGFVISRPASDASLAGLAPDPRPEGAGESAVDRHLLVLVSSTSSLLRKESCFPIVRLLLQKE